MNINWTKTASVMTNLPSRELHKLIKHARRELEARHAEAQEHYKWQVAGYQGLANFFGGAAWAMACRQALRQSKGHEPKQGVRPQSGEMWLPREVLACVRHQVKERTWHPITALNFGDFKDRLLAEPEYRAGLAREREEALDVGGVPRLNRMQFVGRMARGEARREVSDRFDYGGES